MSKPVKRLGRGLSSLISIPEPEEHPPVPMASVASAPLSSAEQKPEPATPVPADDALKDRLLRLRVNQLRPNPYQPRQEMPSAGLQALSQSIRQTGVLQPITARQIGPDVYEIIAGERRWRAAQMAGLSEVPVVVRQATPEEMLEIALVENIFREDLNAIERAEAYRRYCREFSLNAEQVAERLGEDRSTVANYLRLLELPQETQQMVVEQKLSMGHARALLGLKQPEEIRKLAGLIVAGGLSVRAAEKMVQDRLAARAAASQPPEPKADKRPLVRELEQQFTRSLGSRVEILESRRKGRGKIVIHYASLDDFDEVSRRLGVDLHE